MKHFFLFACLLFHFISFAQRSNYIDSLIKFQKNYVQTHEVVNDSNRRYFQFFPVSEKYRIMATFKKTEDTKGFIMKTSGTKTRKYFKYGILSFTLDKKNVNLNVYQSEQLMKDDKYKNYLFIPYTDLTSGNKSYGGGKYLDILIDDIQNNTLLLDFNKAYNPYCAYASGYNCPIPPRENDLPVSINAGEMNFKKSH